MKKCSEFTLIELLVTVAVIAILAGMLLPALNAARGKALSISCLANIKQMGFVANDYSANHNDYLINENYSYSTDTSYPLNVKYAYNRFRGNTAWNIGNADFGASLGFVTGKSVYYCPVATEKYDLDIMGLSCAPNTTVVSGYGFNKLGHKTNSFRLNKITHPSGMAIVLEGVNLGKLSAPTLEGALNQNTFFRHGGNRTLSSVAFIDGHCAAYDKDKNLPTVWNPRWNAYTSWVAAACYGSYFWSSGLGNTNSDLRKHGF